MTDTIKYFQDSLKKAFFDITRHPEHIELINSFAKLIHPKVHYSENETEFLTYFAFCRARDPRGGLYLDFNTYIECQKSNIDPRMEFFIKEVCELFSISFSSEERLKFMNIYEEWWKKYGRSGRAS